MSTTRLLLLGVVRIFQPAYGYQLRRELLTWNVEAWANVNPGSIYTGLRTLSKHGYLQELEQDGAHRPGRTSYKLTADGETEYFSLLRGMLWTVDGFHPSCCCPASCCRCRSVRPGCSGCPTSAR